MKDFTGKIAVITGGGTGMGRERRCHANRRRARNPTVLSAQPILRFRSRPKVPTVSAWSNTVRSLQVAQNQF
jgi:hypothetical protein